MSNVEKKKGVLGARKLKLKKKSTIDLRDPMFVGMDPSYNGFAIVVIDKDANIIEQKLIDIREVEGIDKVEDKLIYLESEYKFIPNIISLHSVYIEGLSYASKGAFALQLGALHFMIRLMLKKAESRYEIKSPGTIKKFVTGNGHAKKDLMLLKVYKKWGVEFADDNLADAYSLARMALHDYLNETKHTGELN